MKLSYILNEAFNNPLPFEWKQKTKNNCRAIFKVNGKLYYVNFVRSGGMPWEITFELVKGKQKTQAITGTGDASAVFSTVISVIRDWAKEFKPIEFMLSASELNRQSLYRKMLEKYLDGYTVEDLGTTFIMQKKGYSMVSAFDDDESYADDDLYADV